MQSTAPDVSRETSPHPAGQAHAFAVPTAPVFVAITDTRGHGHVLNVAQIAQLTAWPQYFHGLVTLTNEQAIELHREEFLTVMNAVAAFAANPLRGLPLPARRAFLEVSPQSREEYVQSQKALYGAARAAGLDTTDRDGRIRFASQFLGEPVHSWRTLTPAEMNRAAGAIAAGAVLPGWHYVPGLAAA